MLQQVQCTPYGGQHQLHCILIPAEDDSETYVMKYEYLGAYWPLLTAKRKRERFYKRCYDIRLADSTLNCEQIGERSVNEMWADLVSPIQRSRDREGWLRRFLNRLRIGRRYVMDTVSDTNSDNSETRLHSDDPDTATPPPLVAQVQGNKLLKKFKYFKSGHEFGCIDIKTHYVKCQPRDISLVLHGEHGSSLSLKSKKPEWNERFGVFELDFGGRINCDSIKNFQIEHEDKIVRIIILTDFIIIILWLLGFPVWQIQFRTFLSRFSRSVDSCFCIMYCTIMHSLATSVTHFLFKKKEQGFILLSEHTENNNIIITNSG